MARFGPGRHYHVIGAYGTHFVELYIGDELHGTVVSGVSRRNATEIAKALTAAYAAGMTDGLAQAGFIDEPLKSPKTDNSGTSTD